MRVVPAPGGRLRVQLHSLFLFAPDEVLTVLGRYLANPLDDAAGAAVDGFVAGEAERLERLRDGATPARAPRCRVRGQVHHLDRIFEQLNATEFDGAVAARITWGQGRRRDPRRRSILFGSYTPGEPGLIRIHPALDQSFVPRIFVELVVFHEMLHAVIPIFVHKGRRIVHPPEFRARERAWVHYVEASRWERENLHRFLNVPAGVGARSDPAELFGELSADLEEDDVDDGFGAASLREF